MPSVAKRLAPLEPEDKEEDNRKNKVTLECQCPNVKIINNFLHNRAFRVHVNNTYSNSGTYLSGVPQGSVLSPYLYNIYTYDIPQHSAVSTCLFADDSAVLSQGVQLKYTIKAIQNFLDKLEIWLSHWRIAINIDKSQAIIFRKWRRGSSTHLSISDSLRTTSSGLRW
ncbi:RNA-directed DNA polymerase from mobile element jockey [Trichonephila clavipes]|nr:RNA-directed DNA polymerase from mobile element jockey [Trichonephila clavipes]